MKKEEEDKNKNVEECKTGVLYQFYDKAETGKYNLVVNVSKI